MQLEHVIRSIPSPVVVVDDSLLPPNFKLLSSAALTALYSVVDEDSGKLKSLVDILGLDGSVEAAEAVEVAEARAEELWHLYVEKKFPELLDPLFSELAAMYGSKRHRVDCLIGILTELYGVVPATFSSLEDASGTLATCAVAFIDYYVKADIDNDEAATALHVEYKEVLCSKYSFEGREWPKVVFLISHDLPSPDGLARFRKLTGMRSAFFVPVDKTNIELRYVQRLMHNCIESYPMSVKLSCYLDTVHDAINSASRAISREIGRLELHDLVALKSLRLDAESESVQSYLTWLVSEALAAKVRSAPELKTSLIPSQSEYIPIDGKLLPQSVLFELYSEIAAAPISTVESEQLIMGDVFEVLEGDLNRASRELVLVVAPACDLMRCAVEYDVMCVRGSLLDTSAELSELLGKSYSFGKGQLVLKHSVEQRTVYSKIAWDKKKLCTIKRKDFNDQKRFQRLARLSDVFAGEVKELALSHLARVGTPIDPSFSIALKALVRCKVKLSREISFDMHHDLGDKDFISAILSMGREASADDESSDSAPLQETILFSAQFQSWVLDTLQNAHAQLPEGGEFTKVDKILNYFGDPKNLRVVSGESILSGAIKIKYVASIELIPEVCTNFEVWLTPYDRV